MQSALAKVDADLAEPGLFERDLPRATELSRRRADVVEKIAAAEDEWLAASEEHEAAKSAAE